MKISIKQLKQIIKEELENVISEQEEEIIQTTPDQLGQEVNVLLQHLGAYSQDPDVVKALGSIGLPAALEVIRVKIAKGERPGQPEEKSLSSIMEKELTEPEKKEKEKIVKGMKKDKKGFKKRYGDDAESVMYATATKIAKEKK
jgi:hypothetical protein